METKRLVRYLFVGAIFLTLVTLFIAYVALGEVLAIKGSYLLIGLVLAAVLYQNRSKPDESLQTLNHLSRWTTKIIVILTISAYLITYITGTRLEVVVITLLIGYSLIAYQILFGKPTRAIVPQIGILFTVSPVTKYLSTGFYFGATDLLGHVRAVELLYRTGRLESIARAYVTYDTFPALHILSGAISSFTGLSAYDSLVVLGILTYTVATIVVFYLCRSILSPSKSITITLVFSTLSVIHNYTTYFFPQALATALIIFLVYIAIRRQSVPSPEYPLLSLAAILLTISVVITHHVTQIILAGLVGVLYTPSLLRRTEFGHRLHINENLPRFILILFTLTAGITYLFIRSPSTVNYFTQFTTDVIDTLFVTDTGGGRSVVGLGTEIPYQTPWDGVRSLFYVDGLYYIGLSALFITGMMAIVISYKQYTDVAGFILLGAGGALAVLKTPLPDVVSRLSLPLAFFFSIIVGIGLWHLTEPAFVPSDTSIRDIINKRQAAVFVLIVLVSTTGPLVAADDLYGLHAGPNLWETYSTPEQQVEFSQQELHEFETTVHHVDRYTSETTMLWVSREASDRFGGEERSAPTEISEEGIRTDGPLVYRTNWVNHQVGYETDELGTLAIADWWLDREIGASNKVYTTGMVGIVGTESGTYLSANRTSNTEQSLNTDRSRHR